MTAISSDHLVGESQSSNSPSQVRPRAARALASAVPVIQGGFVGLGGLVALTLILLLTPLLGAGSVAVSPVVTVGCVALVTLLGFGLAGFLIARLLRAGAEAMDVWTDRAETADAAERLILSALERIEAALERMALRPSIPAGSLEPAPLGSLAEISRAIRDADWEHAAALIRVFTEQYPDAPDGVRVARELELARAEEARGLHAKIAAAREVSDPDRVLELRDALRPLLDLEALHTLDQELTRWLMALIQKRLRAGTIRIDVVELAAKVADRFDHLSEGASLRAALPTLRRSAGLCARCGKPYTGIDDACPVCLAPSPPSSSPSFSTEDDPESSEVKEEDQIFQTDDSL